MTSFQMADTTVTELVNEIMHKNHPDLVECGVRIGVLMAYDPDGPAIKHGGFPVLACVRVVSLKDRITKGFDVEMLIDQTEWNDLPPKRKISTVDHELTHINRVPNTPKAMKAGESAWKTDDLDRPKIKLRKGDVMVGDGFASCIDRHGDDAVEFVNIERAMRFAKRAKGDEPEKSVDAGEPESEPTV